MRVVAALGGNALLRPGEPLEASVQRRNAERAAAALLPIALQHELVVTHGNGPQVGLLALESGLSGAAGPYPLDVLGAESQGMIGYLLGLALRGQLPLKTVVTVLTDVEVDPRDPAFASPAKPVGPLLTTPEAVATARARGWRLAPDRGALRRVVPSPEPLRVLEAGAIARLARAGMLVIAAGGGGIPLVREDGRYRGLEAVVDKDLTSALLARELEAQRLLLLTDVPGVYAGGRLLRRASPGYLRSLGLAPGTMGPKAEAACRFVESGGSAAIGAIEDAASVMAGEAGTEVCPDGGAPAFEED